MNYNTKTHPMKIKKPEIQDLNQYKKDEIKILNEDFIKVKDGKELRYVNKKNIIGGVWNHLI